MGMFANKKYANVIHIVAYFYGIHLALGQIIFFSKCSADVLCCKEEHKETVDTYNVTLSTDVDFLIEDTGATNASDTTPFYYGINQNETTATVNATNFG